MFKLFSTAAVMIAGLSLARLLKLKYCLSFKFMNSYNLSVNNCNFANGLEQRNHQLEHFRIVKQISNWTERL